MSAVHEIFRPMLETFGDPAKDKRRTLRDMLIADVRVATDRDCAEGWSLIPCHSHRTPVHLSMGHWPE